LGFGQVSHDIHDRKQAELALEESIRRLRILCQRLLTLQEDSKRRLVRKLHDEFSQTITGLKLNLAAGTSKADENLKEHLAAAISLLDELVEKARSLSLELRPPMLDDLGLLPTLLWYFQDYLVKTRVAVEFVHEGIEGRFTPAVETAAYRIVQEALSNVARHAAVNDATVCVSANQHQLHLEVSDQGKGFVPEAMLGSHASSGLLEMQERAELLNGHLTINSMLGRGTSIIAAIPLTASEMPSRDLNQPDENHDGKSINGRD
jgi:signal transduction histidine kinase